MADSLPGHGYLPELAAAGLKPPRRIHASTELARPGYASMSKDEFEDDVETLRAKVRVLLRLLKTSSAVVAYTGAGISTAAGVLDYATAEDSDVAVRTPGTVIPPGAEGAPPKLRSPYEAQPTMMHRVLVALWRQGLLSCWVQQNHDGLPQKAGFPQWLLNEIHGSWYDPSNPVIPMTGELRGDLFQDLLELETKADTVLAFGTSLAGMNADRLAQGAAERHQKSVADGSSGAGGGLAICSLQRTQFDHLASIRFWAKLDSLAELIVQEFELSDLAAISEASGETSRAKYPVEAFVDNLMLLEERTVDKENDIYLVPYSPTTGARLENHESLRPEQLCRLDLSEDAEVKLTQGPYAGDCGEVVGKQLEGHWKIRFQHPLKPGARLKRPFERILGTWWVAAAIMGKVPQIPVVNVL